MWRWDQIHNIVTIVDYSHICLYTLPRKRMSVEKTLMFYVFSYISVSTHVATQADATLIFTANLCLFKYDTIEFSAQMLGNRCTCKQDTIESLGILEINFKTFA